MSQSNVEMKSTDLKIRQREVLYVGTYERQMENRLSCVNYTILTPSRMNTFSAV